MINLPTAPGRLAASRVCRFLLPALTASLLTACQDKPAGPSTFQGYVEGEFLYLAAPQGGYLRSLEAGKGRRVQAGDRLFVVAADPDTEALAEAQARSAAARERVANLQEPRRQSEIAALEASLRAAEAGERLARQRLERQKALAAQNFVSPASIDEAASAQEQAQAQAEAARQQLASYRATLGRGPEVRGAQADLQAAQAQAAQRRWVVERKTVQAPAAGEVADTYYRPGEWVPAGSPVASLLPDGRRRLRFFVPETALAALQPGQAVEASCDGCLAPIRATVDFIAPQAEYTPPVIYSQGNREKLVYRVEAAPEAAQAASLRPGLPVDVRLAQGPSAVTQPASPGAAPQAASAARR